LNNIKKLTEVTKKPLVRILDKVEVKFFIEIATTYSSEETEEDLTNNNNNDTTLVL
jgi:hypothetical protein